MAASNKLGRGELSSIALCKKIGEVFLKDDQKARRIGGSILGNDKIQTIPHITGWLLMRK